MGKQAIATTPWPPPEPAETNAAFFGGFPGILRLWLRRNAVSFGLHLAQTPITTVTDRQITRRFNREDWIPVEGRRVPPPGTDLGGLSGGPVLLPLGTEEGVWHFEMLEPDRQPVAVRMILKPSRPVDQCSGDPLQAEFEKRAVMDFEQPVRDMDSEIGVDADQVGIVMLTACHGPAEAANLTIPGLAWSTSPH
jgi:hypothetical protein